MNRKSLAAILVVSCVMATLPVYGAETAVSDNGWQEGSESVATADVEAESETPVSSEESDVSEVVYAESSVLTEEEELVGAGTRAMYRLYNPNSGEHFYTASAGERDATVKAGWNDEGIGWYAPTSGNPVYRVYNPNAGDHHYTLSKGEKDALVKLGWRDEGIGWYSDRNKTVAVLRAYNPNAKAGAHNFTTSAGEQKALVKAGWKDEGIGWYASAVGKPSSAATLSFEDDTAYASITADVKLGGTGSGYHSKVDISDSSGVVVSFGIVKAKGINTKGSQYRDDHAFLLENVMSHATEAGTRGKQYLYYPGAKANTTYRIRLSWFKNGKLRYYVNDKLIGETTTTLQAPFIFTVEGSTCYRGDTINTTMKNIRIKAGDSTRTNGIINTWNANDNYWGLKSTITKTGTVRSDGKYNTHGEKTYGIDVKFTGTSTIPSHLDWDTCFQAVEPNTKEKGKPESAMVKIAQSR